MCDRCAEIEQELVDTEIDELEDYDTLETIRNSYENSFLPPLEIPLEYYDNEDFYKGFKAYQELAGSIVALTNVGLHPSEALGMIMNRETMAHNLEIAKINENMNIQVSKNTLINAEKNSL